MNDERAVSNIIKILRLLVNCNEMSDEMREKINESINALGFEQSDKLIRTMLTLSLEMLSIMQKLGVKK